MSTGTDKKLEKAISKAKELVRDLVCEIGQIKEHIKGEFCESDIDLKNEILDLHEDVRDISCNLNDLTFIVRPVHRAQKEVNDG